MSATRIQVRRGYSSTYSGAIIGSTPLTAKWASNTQLAEGEIGYEIDTGRFKIGKYVSGSLATWGNLPYAGGSSILPGSGMATQFDETNNRYILHSPLATGNNITLAQYQVVGNGTTAPSGSGYTIGLSENISVGSIQATGTGITSNFNDLGISGTLTVGGGIDILLAAEILASGPISYSGNPTRFQGDVYFDNVPKVGPTGDGGINATGVSLEGHTHQWSDITDLTGFCDDVATCVDTELVASTGLQLIYDANTVSLALSGQALAFHNYTGTGILVRTGDSAFSNREITNSGNNIWIGNGNGINGNISVGLNPVLTNITSLTTTGDVNIGGNLVVQGDTITANVSSISVEDPVIVLGGTGTITGSDTFDRGLLLRYWGGAAVATGFMGWDYNNSEFAFLSSTTGSISGNDYGAGTLGRIKAGSLVTTGAISGSNIYVTGATASTIAIFDGNKQIVSTGSPTLTELSYLSGVSSNIQTQLNNKLASDRTVFPGSGLDGNSALSLSGNPTLNIGAGYGISVGQDTVAVDTSVVVMITGTQTVSGTKTFNNGSTTNVNIATASNGTGTLTFQDGSDTATISWQGLNNNLVFDSSVAAGTFDFNKTIRYKVPATGTTATSIPVFTGTNPSSSVQTIAARSLSDFKSDLSLNNVTNNSQMIAYGGRTSGYIPTWSGTDGITLNNGYAVSSSNTGNAIVLRDSNGDFTARNITATGFIGNGSSVTGVSAFNLNIYSNSRTETEASLVMISGASTGNYRPFIDSGLKFNANTDTLILKNASGNVNVSYLSNSIDIIGTTSISGLSSTTYLLNFIIDGGTP
jgi:hypothetical protein